MGPTTGVTKKLQLHPTNLTYPTAVMWWRGWGSWFGDGFAQCVVLRGGFLKECRCVCRGWAKMNNSLIHSGNYNFARDRFY